MLRYGERIHKTTTDQLIDIFTRLGLVVSVGGTGGVTPVESVESTPPGAPVTGETYLVGCNATGAWAGQEGMQATWDGTMWFFTMPTSEKIFVAEDSGILYTRNNALGFDATVDYHLFYENTYGYWQGPILDSVTTPPGVLNDGDRYRVVAPATGDFLGQEDKIATYYCGQWSFQDLPVGAQVYDIANATYLQFDQTNTFVTYNAVPNATFDISPTPTLGDLLVWDGSNFVNQQFGVDDLSGLPAPASAGQVLTALTVGPNTYGWTTVSGGGGGATELNDLTDVDTVSNPPNLGTERMFLQWFGSNWQPAQITTNELSNVASTFPAVGQALVWTGSQYVPQTVALSSENVRMVRGIVIGSSGAIVVGSGFTVSRLAAGQYRINLSPAFTSTVVVVVSLASVVPASADRSIRVGNESTFNFQVNIRTGAGNFIDDRFSFIAVGSA